MIINIQNSEGKTKAFQILQALKATDKLEKPHTINSDIFYYYPKSFKSPRFEYITMFCYK
jgi:hypothetical protein